MHLHQFFAFWFFSVCQARAGYSLRDTLELLNSWHWSTFFLHIKWYEIFPPTRGFTTTNLFISSCSGPSVTFQNPLWPTGEKVCPPLLQGQRCGDLEFFLMGSKSAESVFGVINSASARINLPNVALCESSLLPLLVSELKVPFLYLSKQHRSALCPSVKTTCVLSCDFQNIFFWGEIFKPKWHRRATGGANQPSPPPPLPRAARNQRPFEVHSGLFEVVPRLPAVGLAASCYL